MQYNLKGMYLLAIMLFIGTALFAQPKENDPYSLLGLGNLTDLDFAGVSAMPGLSATYHDPYHANIQNPAASSFLAVTAFEAGGYYQYKNMKTPFDSDVINTGNLNYLSLGFPVFNPLNKLNERKANRKQYSLGMTLSLVPYSRVGFDLVQRDSFANIGNVESTFESNGSTYKFLWGNSFRYKSFSIGANIGYLFGKQTSEHWDYFLDLENEYRNRFVDEVSIGGFTWNMGALYEYVIPQKKEFDDRGKEIFKPRTRITLGVFGNSKTVANTTNNLLYTRRQTLGGFLSDIDTISINSEDKGRIELPAEVGFGIMVSKDATWKIGFDYTYSGWSKYSNSLRDEELNNSFEFAFGAEYTPDFDALKRYGKRITYRIGGLYKTDPRTIPNGEQLTQRALTLGVRLPLQPDVNNRKLISSVNLAAEIGQYGDADFLQETYFQLNLGFTLNDNLWFYKSKYN